MASVLVVAAAVAGLISAGVSGGQSFATVHAPFPGAVMARLSVQTGTLGQVSVQRQYVTRAPFHDVVGWFQGKDSLMPVTKGVNAGCFSQSYRARPYAVVAALNGRVTEQVTVCATATGVTIRSVVTITAPKVWEWVGWSRWGGLVC